MEFNIKCRTCTAQANNNKQINRIASECVSHTHTHTSEWYPTPYTNRSIVCAVHKCSFQMDIWCFIHIHHILHILYVDSDFIDIFASVHITANNTNTHARASTHQIYLRVWSETRQTMHLYIIYILMHCVGVTFGRLHSNSRLRYVLYFIFISIFFLCLI